MTDAERKRVYVSDLYLGPKWKRRVMKMRDDQVTAIYLQHQKDGVKPEHDESEPLSEPKTEPRLDISPNGRGPHANEDQFPMY